MKRLHLIGALIVVALSLALGGAALAGKASPPVRQQPAQSAEKQSSESGAQNTAETESSAQNDPGQGHEDPVGQDVNHECTGDCQE
jgi:hypothetical protein